VIEWLEDREEWLLEHGDREERLDFDAIPPREERVEPRTAEDYEQMPTPTPIPECSQLWGTPSERLAEKARQRQQAADDHESQEDDTTPEDQPDDHISDVFDGLEDQLDPGVVADGSGEIRVDPETDLVNMGSHGREGVTPIDRSTRFGNPFRLEKDGGGYTREGSIEAYRVWFTEQLEDNEFREAVEDLRGETLGCWCKPKACHGDVLLEYLETGEVDVPETAPSDPRPSDDDTEQVTLDAGDEVQEGRS
jgi:hypothetical protein